MASAALELDDSPANIEADARLQKAVQAQLGGGEEMAFYQSHDYLRPFEAKHNERLRAVLRHSDSTDNRFQSATPECAYADFLIAAKIHLASQRGSVFPVAADLTLLGIPEAWAQSEIPSRRVGYAIAKAMLTKTARNVWQAYAQYRSEAETAFRARA